MWFRFVRREAEARADAALGILPGDPDGPDDGPDTPEAPLSPGPDGAEAPAEHDPTPATQAS
jgi:hypothetical protein